MTMYQVNRTHKKIVLELQYKYLRYTSCMILKLSKTMFRRCKSNRYQPRWQMRQGTIYQQGRQCMTMPRSTTKYQRYKRYIVPS